MIKTVIHGKPHVHVGKNGLSKTVIKQIVDLIEKKKVIKIKFLSFDEFNNFDDAVKYLENSAKVKIVDVRGKSVVIQHRIS